MEGDIPVDQNAPIKTETMEYGDNNGQQAPNDADFKVETNIESENESQIGSEQNENGNRLEPNGSQFPFGNFGNLPLPLPFQMQKGPDGRPLPLPPLPLQQSGPGDLPLPLPFPLPLETQLQLQKEKSPKKPRIYLSIEEKLHIIEESKLPGFNQTRAAKKYGVAKSSISRILTTDTEKITQISKTFAGAKMINRKQCRIGPKHKVEQLVYEWYLKSQETGLHVTGKMLSEKAKEFDAQMGNNSNTDKEFGFTNGWMNNFKKRFNVVLSSPSSKKKAAVKNLKAVDEWMLSKYPSLKCSYMPDQIYNLDTTTLFYRGLPDEENVLTHRMGVLLCCNMSGTDKRRLLIIGKDQKPVGFPDNLDDLPVMYTYNRQSRMNICMLQEYLLDWDRELSYQDQKVVLLLDYSVSPNIKVELRHINLEFMPPGFTQPCDSGISRVFKGHYRSLLCERVMHQTDLYPEKTPNDLAMRISCLDAIHMCNFAWKRLTDNCIVNCFKKAFETNFTMPNLFDEISIPAYMDKFSFLNQIEVETTEYDDSEEPEDTPLEESEDVSTHEALIYLDRIRSYLQKHGCNDGALNALQELENTCFQHKIQKERELATQVEDNMPDDSDYFPEGGQDPSDFLYIQQT